MTTAQTSIAKLTAFLNSKFNADPLYQRLHMSLESQEHLKPIPHIDQLYPGLYVNAMAQSHKAGQVGLEKHKVAVKTLSGDSVVFENISVPPNFPYYLNPLWHTCTYNSDNFLCFMMSGELSLLKSYELYQNEDIVGVLQFPTDITTLLHQDGTEYKALEGKGYFEGCKNLVFIAPIPEGYRNIGRAFRNCVKLNCPIFLPSSVDWCAGMLDGCNSFSSPIFTHKKLQQMDGYVSYPYGFSVEPYARYLTTY